MGRTAEGYKLVARPSGVYAARFRLGAKRYMVSTGECDQGKAHAAASKIYADVVAGAWRPTPEMGGGKAPPLEDLMSLWIVDEQAGKPPGIQGYEIYAGAHYLPFFKTLEGMTEATIGNYARTRLTKVLRKSVQNELTGLRSFFRWLVQKEVVSAIPKFPVVSKKLTGVRVQPRRRVPPLSPEQVRSVLDAMPEHTRSGRTNQTLWLRPYFIVAWSTGLRPRTLAQLRVPEHFKKGQRFLNITEEIDKARFARELPLTAEAQEMLERVSPPDGIIFGKHDLRSALIAACRKAGLPVRKMVPYDFRHLRGTHLLEATGNLPGVAYMLGHTQVTTTNKYIKSSQRAAEDVLEQVRQREEKNNVENREGREGNRNEPEGVLRAVGPAPVRGLAAGEGEENSGSIWDRKGGGFVRRKGIEPSR